MNNKIWPEHYLQEINREWRQTSGFEDATCESWLDSYIRGVGYNGRFFVFVHKDGNKTSFSYKDEKTKLIALDHFKSMGVKEEQLFDLSYEEWLSK